MTAPRPEGSWPCAACTCSTTATHSATPPPKPSSTVSTSPRSTPAAPPGSSPTTRSNPPPTRYPTASPSTPCTDDHPMTWWPDGDINAGRIPVSALEHYAYCPRQAALIHIDGAWTDDEDTVR